MAAVQHMLKSQPFFFPVKVINAKSFSGATPLLRKKRGNTNVSLSRMDFSGLSSQQFLKSTPLGDSFIRSGLRASKIVDNRKSDDKNKARGEEYSSTDKEDDLPLMDEEDRQELRRKIREVIDMNPDVEEEIDPVERRKKMQKLLADYPLVVEEDDPDWPEDADGWGFNLGQFFNKISIKNVKKDNGDENNDTENEMVWQDDDYIRPIKDITTAEWEETVFKDISPLVVLVHNRYKRPKENENMRDELEKAVQIIWNCRLPSPRVRYLSPLNPIDACVAVDAVVELDLVSALRVPVCPQLLFTKAGKILHRETAIRTAEELSKIMAFFYYGATKPPCLHNAGKYEEIIPTLIVVNIAAAKVIVVMETEGKELPMILSIKLAVSYTHSAFLSLPPKYRETFSSTMRKPESEFATDMAGSRLAEADL
ncbi:hypothetical protein RJ639_032921 [Escallonia herrerae]|uniref:Thioredoxin-like fold domain-containing protein MRL7L, chloroplastic n=1 Tax=Escallonia herrerae TaxID=1293975 RepID=A0AA88X1W2_9ASTE|nr:hypothetical protein RJ639_032921 [Escallonia herrerae]